LFVYAGIGLRNKRSFVCVRWYGIEKQTVVCLGTLLWDRETNGRLFVYAVMR